MAMLSVLGLYNYDPSIFQAFRVPGVADITDDAEKSIRWIPDRQTAIDYILMACGEMSLVYTDPEFVKFAIANWTRRRFPIWRDLYNSTLYKYVPIWNKDGTITEDRDLSENEDETNSGSQTTGKTTIDDENTSGSEITDRTITDDENTSGTVDSSGETDADLRGNVTAFDTDSYSPNDQQTQDINTSSHADHSGERDLTRDEDATVTTSGERDLTRTETGSATSSGTRDRDRTENEKTVRVEQGNIGVTTTQAMIQEQRDISLFSLYDVIMQDFKHEFCVMIY